jgi:hypothetical protein
MRSPSFIVALAVVAALASVSAFACSSTEVQPASISGEYVLETFNGATIPAQPAPNTVIDTGYAKLHASGAYEIYVRRFVAGSPSNYIVENGTWTASDRTVQFSGAAVQDNIAVSADGRFTVNVLVGTQQSLAFRRIGDAP